MKQNSTGAVRGQKQVSFLEKRRAEMNKATRKKDEGMRREILDDEENF
jgi:hypothetical protein